MSETGLETGPFDEKPNDEKKRLIRTAVLTLAFGILGIGASLGAVYFLSSGSGFFSKFRASVGDLVALRDAAPGGASATPGSYTSKSSFPQPKISRRSASVVGTQQEEGGTTPVAESDAKFSPSAAPVPKFGKILISEIQIAGVSKDDEFIELYNPNDFAVALDGFESRICPAYILTPAQSLIL